MVRSDANDRLVQALSVDLTPVRRLAAPALRVLLWLAIVGAVALALAMVSDVGAMIRRLTAAPDMWVAALSSMLTAVLAAAAAFQLSLPDRKAAWALVPLPAVLLWIGASGMGCLESLGLLRKSIRCHLISPSIAWSLFSASPYCCRRLLDHHAAARLLIAAQPHSNHWRSSLRFRCGHAPQLHSPLRCGGYRFSRACVRGGDCHLGEYPIRRPHPFEKNALTAGSNRPRSLISFAH